MKIGIVGTGISGMVAAYLLHRDHDLTIYEANDYIGGHTATVDVRVDNGQSLAVDTGFIVYNDRTYPNFVKLLKKLSVETQPSTMSFSVRDEARNYEYAGGSLNEFFGQRANVFRPSHYKMLTDVLRFYREAPALLRLANTDDSLTLGEYLERNRYSRAFIRDHILPMAAAIWSGSSEQMLSFPCRYFVQFFKNHGMMDMQDRPQWRVIKGGSREYMKKLTAGFCDRIRLSTPVAAVNRGPNGVTVRTQAGGVDTFDRLIIATHSDQALRMLKDPTDAEREVLGAIPYQSNAVTLHTDLTALPRRKKLWAAWNYYLPKKSADSATITYNMNILQSLPVSRQFLVSLNLDEVIAANNVVRRFVYGHPVYEPRGIAAQKRHDEINGPRHTYFAGAYWGYGFHEDGVKSALAVCKQFEVDLEE